MKKTVYIVATVCAVMVLLCVPCFAAETTVDRGDPVDWFGSVGVVEYTVSYTYYSGLDLSSGDPDHTWASWLFAAGAVSESSAIGSFSVRSSGSGSFASGYALYSSDGVSVSAVNSGTSIVVSVLSTGSATVSSDSGYSFTSSLAGNNVSVTYVEGGVDGFVDSGVSDALTELSLIVSAILSNQYIMIAIGLAVAVPLVAWGISKIKSLVKGY